MARTSMSSLITRLRGMTNAGTADYTIAGSAYWTDDQLQEVLDQHRRDLNRVVLDPEPEYAGGTAYYYDYYAPVGNLEAYNATDANVFQVEDMDGDAAGTADYTADYLRGVIRFDADQGGTSYYLRGRTYNVNAAAADVWRRKAAHVADRFDIATDNHRLSRSQMIQQYLAMAQNYDREAGIRTATFVRTDLN